MPQETEGDIVSPETGPEIRISEFGNTPESYNNNTYTFDQLKEVWYIGMISGATLFKVCQDNTTDTLSSFEKLTNELRNTVTSEQSIKDLCSSQTMLLGVSAEILGLDRII